MNKFKIKIVSAGKSLNFKNGLYVYGIRHSENDWNEPIAIEKLVVVDRYGYIVSKRPLDKIVNAEKRYYILSDEERQTIMTRIDTGWFDVRELFEQYE